MYLSSKHKTDNGTILLHLSNSNRISRILWKTRIAHKLHLWSRREKPGDFQCILALSFQAHVQSGKRAMCQPYFHWTRYCSLLVPKDMQPFCPFRLSCRYMAKQEITMTCERFAIAGEGEVGAVCKWLLTKNCRSRIVHRHECAMLMSSINKPSQITNIKTRIAGCFQPE